MASLKVVDHYITYRGVNLLSSFHVKIDGNQTFQTAKRDVERFAVPGRNGDLTIDDGRFDPFTLPYDAYIVDDWQKNSANLAAFLLRDAAPHRLEDTIHPDIYRMAAFEGTFDPEVIWLSSGRFTLNFHCQPECWLKIGERKTAVDDSATVMLKNPTSYPAKPLIKVTQGTGMISVGDTIIQLTVTKPIRRTLTARLKMPGKVRAIGTAQSTGSRETSRFFSQVRTPSASEAACRSK